MNHHILYEPQLKRMWAKDEDEEDAPDWSDMWGEEMAEWTGRAVREGVLDVNHGDTIHWLHNNHYRNNGLMFWSEDDGIVFPCTDYDDYGSVPKCFRVGEHGFRPDHWLEYVDHNAVVFLSDALVEILQKKKDEKKDEQPPFLISLEIYGIDYVARIYHDKPVRTLFDYSGRLLEQF